MSDKVCPKCFGDGWIIIDPPDGAQDEDESWDRERRCECNPVIPEKE